LEVQNRKHFRENIRRQIVGFLRRGCRSMTNEGYRPPDPGFIPFKVWFTFLAMALMACLWGCENEQKIQRGVASGYVLDLAGNRVVGAVITSHRSLYKAVSDDSGRYTFTSLDTGTHRLSVERDGFKTASRTISIAFGQVEDNIDFQLEPLPNRIAWTIFKRESTAVTIDVVTVEAMKCVAAYQGEHMPVTRTQSTELGVDHRFVLSPLRSDTEYWLTIEGTTADGRRFSSASGTFSPLPTGDLPGAPIAPTQFSLIQTRDGPKLAWNYEGSDPLKGFRIYRAEEDKALQLWQDEDYVFMAQRSVVDDSAVPGARVRYALCAVDLDGNVSSLTQELVLFPGGKLSSDITWKKNWSPIDLYGDIWVPEKRTFTIEPGTVIRVSSQDLSQGGYDPLKCEIIIEGKLLVQASGSAPVRFISAASLPSKSDWEGIKLRAARDQPYSEIINLEVSNAESGISLGDSVVNINQFTGIYCETGFQMQGASGTMLSDLKFKDCANGFLAESTLGCQVQNVYCDGGNLGISLRGNRAFTLLNFDLRGISDTGLSVDDTASPTVKGGVIASAKLGMSVKGASAVLKYLTIDSSSGIVIDGADMPVLMDCILINRLYSGTGIGIEEKKSGRSYLYNNIFGFKTATENCDQMGGPILNVDPQFIGGGGVFDYHLQAESPMRTASDKGGEIGAYGLGAE